MKNLLFRTFMNINFFAFLFLGVTLLFTGEVLGKTQYLPDALYNFNARQNDGYGGHLTPDSCTAYGLTTCQGQKILRPEAIAIHPLPSLNCYRENDCICPDDFIYDETNCYNIVGQIRKSAAGSLICDGKSDTCYDNYHLKYYLVKNGVFCGNNELCSGCPKNTVPQDDGSLSFINTQTEDHKVDSCICLLDDYPLTAPLDGGDCDKCINSTGDISYRCVCKAGYKCAEQIPENSSSWCESGCERDCPAQVSCDTGRREVKSDKKYCEDITVDCCPLAVEDCDHGCKKRSDQSGCEDLCVECRSRPETTGAVRLAFDMPTEDRILTLPVSGNNLNVDIDWGDGTIDYEVTSSTTHTYSTGGLYEIKISGYAEKIHVASSDKSKLEELLQLNLSSITDISNAFSDATNLSGSIPQLPPMLQNGYRAFDSSPNLTGDIPQFPVSLTSTEWMFNGCRGLNGNIPTLPPEITSGAYMFANCSGLTGDVPHLPEKLVSGEGMFANCSSLNGSIPKLPKSLQNGSQMFQNCSNLTGDVPELPNSLQIGRFMFNGCSNLDGKIMGLSDALTDGHYMFAGCSNLTGDVPQLPDSLTQGSGMFIGCTNLDGQITGFGKGLTTASFMFANCSKLSGDIPALPENLQNGSQMFQNCSNLTGNIPELPQTLQNGGYMFAGCSNLTGVTSVNGLYPYEYLSQITSYTHLVTDCSNDVRRHFPVSWGGLLDLP